MIPPPDPAPRFVPLFLIGLAVRAVVVAAGVLLAAAPPPDSWHPPRDSRMMIDHRARILAGSARPIEPWYRWDALWVAEVATHGYSPEPDEEGHRSVAFQPLLPAVMAAGGAAGIDLYWVGLLAPNLAAAAGAAVAARVAARLTGDRGTGVRTFCFLQAFPFAFFFSAPYHEAFGLLFTSLALAAWQAGRAGPAAAATFAGSLARLTGPGVGLGVLAEWALGRRDWRGFWRAALVAAAGVGGVFAYWGYLGLAVGDVFASPKAHAAWGRAGPSGVWAAVAGVFDPSAPGVAHTVNLALFAGLGLRAWIKRGPLWGVVTLAPIVLLVASGSLLSSQRVVLACLPGFFELADLIRRPVAVRAVVAGSAAVQAYYLCGYVHWQFIG